MKNVIIILTVLWVAFAFMGFIFWGDAKEKIQDAEKDLKEYQDNYVRIKTTCDSLSGIVQYLKIQRIELDSKVDSLNGRIVKLEFEMDTEVIRVARLFTPDDIVEEFKLTFPKFKNAPMGITNIRHPVTDLPIKLFQIPIQLVSSFIADRKEVQNCFEQKEVFKKLNMTYEEVVALIDSIGLLKDQKLIAYEDGLRDGKCEYEELNKKYISTLQKPPKVSLFPNKAGVWLVAAAGAAGYALGTK